ncbi:MAG: GH3 auxin-responsive promoter family protein, partial [Lachnospiraceae bacterium]|nr:GH3 auxin-responsive promoter family protein [Lachnospiraceae bacterium]
MAGKYQISIVTPFHNTDLTMFERCVQGMKDQTLGFENVEWIVVVHNSDEGSLKAVKNLLSGYDNVRIEVLNNELKTPSSPRNHGLRLATSDYVGFLDSDDSFTPICLKEVLRRVKSCNPQIVWFRREYELEEENNRPVTEIVLWDQTREEILITKDENWDDEKMFSGVCGMVTSRMYNRKFLRDNGIIFDESVPFAEDYLFNLEAYGHADKLLYLPQLIGYHYFINGSSLVQGGGMKSGETLISYAEGYRKVFDAGLKYGFYMNGVMGGLTCVLARFMATSTLLTLEDRQKIKELLEPYLEIMGPLRVSKIYSEKDVINRYEFPRDVILHPEKYVDNKEDILIDMNVRDADPLSDYQAVLASIMEVNAPTDMGRRYGLADILTTKGFQRKLPVTGYDVYQPIIRLQTNIGESGILTSDAIKAYAVSSGTMGTPREIPVTRRQLEPMTDEFAKLADGKVSFLLFESLPHLKKNNDDTYFDSITGLVLLDYLDGLSKKGIKESSVFTSPRAVLQPGEVADLTYVRLLFALARKDIEQIIAPFTWGVVDSFRFLKRHHKELTESIRAGKLLYESGLSDDLKKEIDKNLNADPERADELEAIFKEGSFEGIAGRIWPKLERIIAAGTGTFSIYTDQMKHYTGDIPHINALYASSEALIGTETDTEGQYLLSTRNSFVEFVPLGAGSDTALPAGETEEGREYSLLVTSYAGLYRYKLDDVVKIRGFNDDLPVFTFEGRLSDRINTGYGDVTDGDIYRALCGLSEKTGKRPADYAYLLNEDENSLTV